MGANISYSCYPESGLTNCTLTIRDYELGNYEPLVGYELKEVVGGDYVETAVEVKQ